MWPLAVQVLGKDVLAHLRWSGMAFRAVCALCAASGLQGSIRTVGLKMNRVVEEGASEEGATMIQRRK